MSHFWQKNEVLRWLCQVLLLHRFQFYSYCYSLMVIRRSTNIFPSEFRKKKRHPILSYWIIVRYFPKRKCSLFVLFPSPLEKRVKRKKSTWVADPLLFVFVILCSMMVRMCKFWCKNNREEIEPPWQYLDKTSDTINFSRLSLSEN